MDPGCTSVLSRVTTRGAKAGVHGENLESPFGGGCEEHLCREQHGGR